jgi:hypothetical protein
VRYVYTIFFITGGNNTMGREGEPVDGNNIVDTARPMRIL